jgi:hypothetical protein
MLLGIPGDNTYSNYAEANRAFYRQTVVPLVTRIASALGNWLGENFGGNLRLAPDLDEVPALSIEREALWKRVGEASFLTNDEKRAAAGYEPLPASSLTTLLAKYSPDQPRVPAGSREGGQWTAGGYAGAAANADEGRVVSDENPDELVPGAAYAQNDTPRDVINKHIIDHHINKTDKELISRIETEKLPGLFVRTGRDRNGAFHSVEAARDFINRTIESNQSEIARFLNGSRLRELLTLRFGYETGR